MTSKTCEHRQENGIHIFTLNEGSRQSADDFADMWAQLLKAADPQVPIRVLVDMRKDGPPPLAYGARRVSETYSIYGKPGLQIRSAFVFKDGVLMRMVASFMERTWQRANRRYFQSHQYDEALAWLQTDETISIR